MLWFPHKNCQEIGYLPCLYIPQQTQIDLGAAVPAPATKLTINGLEAIANRLVACGAGHVEESVDFLAPKKCEIQIRDMYSFRTTAFLPSVWYFWCTLFLPRQVLSGEGIVSGHLIRNKWAQGPLKYRYDYSNEPSFHWKAIKVSCLTSANPQMLLQQSTCSCHTLARKGTTEGRSEQRSLSAGLSVAVLGCQSVANVGSNKPEPLFTLWTTTAGQGPGSVGSRE